MRNLSSFAEVQKLPFADRVKQPAPFPGRWPTHVAWQLAFKRHAWMDEDNGRIVPQEKNWTRFNYVGKPNAEQARKLGAMLRDRPWERYSLEITCVEFDRKHRLLIQTQKFQPNHDPRPPHNAVSTLWSAYHPWQPVTFWAEYFRVKNFLKNIGGFRVYSTQKVLKNEYISRYKLWMLENCGKQLKSAQERRAEKMARGEHRV